MLFAANNTSLYAGLYFVGRLEVCSSGWCYQQIGSLLHHKMTAETDKPAPETYHKTRHDNCGWADQKVIHDPRFSVGAEAGVIPGASECNGQTGRDGQLPVPGGQRFPARATGMETDQQPATSR